MPVEVSGSTTDADAGRRNVEASLALLNLTNTDWREAQFQDQTCVRGEVGTPPECSKPTPEKQGTTMSNAGVDDIHFTPGDPFGVHAGLTMYF